MREFVKVVDVAASPERAWEVLAEFSRWPEWTASMTRLTPLDAGPPGVGSRVRVEQPKLRPIVLEIVSWEPGRGFAWRGRQPGVTVFADHRLAPTPGGCRMTLSLRYGGLLGSVVGLLARRLTERYMAMEAEGLKRRSEGRG
ncbi:SRPBCC family protein [Paludisphaera rhizosphaerae]|uniref:SRPBCC family protein n=1 Tax=Paludisphaera rhizosphaerae TaxID=2711216 RepID=UPI00197F77F1|nr:SRPBCC family protein [Paludisphaera rhizosphaerae]